MPHYTYLILGGGMTADAAARGILEVDPDRTIALISAEPHPPYNRPPLSKGLWKGEPLSRASGGTPREPACSSTSAVAPSGSSQPPSA